MNEVTKRITLLAALIFSTSAFVLSMLIFKHQANLDSHLQASVSKKKSAPVTETSTAPARIVSTITENTWLDIQRQVKDTVVQIFSHAAEFNWLEPYKTPEQTDSAGSGFFINDNGDIVTNYHVIAQASSVEIQIPSFGLERFDVEIIGVCPERDIALMTLNKEARDRIRQRNGEKIPFLTLGNSDSILRSQEVLALGYPLGQSRLKSTLGIVSGRERLGSAGFIQITAPINPGNSGGPALDTNGTVIGINTAGVIEAQNVGYIIPINEVKSALKDLYKAKLLRKPTLGCLFTAATRELVDYLGNPVEGGWYLAKVFKGTLLDNVGVKEGDMLYEINGHKIDLYGDINVPWSEDKASLFEFLNRLTVGDTLNFVVYRKGVRKEFSFTFEHKYLPTIRMIYPEFEKAATDYEIIGGMVVMQLSLNHIGLLLSRVPDLVRFGKIEVQYEDPVLILTHVFPNSQAIKTRVLRPGAIIEELNGRKVHSLDDFRQAILTSKDSGFITIRTSDNFYAVMSLDRVLKEEDLLKARYFYPKSHLIDLLSNKPKLKHEK